MPHWSSIGPDPTELYGIDKRLFFKDWWRELEMKTEARYNSVCWTKPAEGREDLKIQENVQGRNTVEPLPIVTPGLETQCENAQQ